MSFLRGRIGGSKPSLSGDNETSAARGRRIRTTLFAAATITLSGAVGQACSFDWDAYDPRLVATSGAGGAGQGGAGASTSSASSSSGSMSSSSGSSSSSSSGQGGAGGAVGSGGGGTGGGTGGSGGSEPLPCGGTDVLSDAFDDGVPGALWYWYAQPGITISEVNGDALVSLPPNSASSAYSSLQTKRLYDLRKNQISVEVKEVGDPATTAQTFLTIARDSDNFIEMSQQGGTMFFSKRVAGSSVDVGTVLFNAQTHKFWRIRDDGATTYWELSADGQTYISHAQLPTAQLFPLDAVDIAIGAQLEGGEVNPGQARFDNINGGGAPTGKWCKASALKDDFEDGVIGLLWNNSYDDPGTTLVEMGGVVVLAPPTNLDGYCGLISGSAYDLTGDSIAVEVPLVVNAGTIASTFLRLEADGYGNVEITERDGTLKFEKEVGGVGTTLASTLYSPVTHKWWRIREDSGTLYWETSADGKTWLVGATDQDPIPMTALDVTLGSGAYQAVAAPGESHFDNLNLTP